MPHKAEKAYINLEKQKILLKAFCTLYNKLYKVPIEIYIVGGSALQWKYGTELRNLTYDIDGWWLTKANVTQCISEVAHRYGVPDDWLNDDVRSSDSFSKHAAMDAQCIDTIGLVHLYVVSDLSQLCMKVASKRVKDSADALALARKLKLVGCTYADVEVRLEQMYGGRVELNKASLKRVARILR